MSKFYYFGVRLWFFFIYSVPGGVSPEDIFLLFCGFVLWNLMGLLCLKLFLAYITEFTSTRSSCLVIYFCYCEIVILGLAVFFVA